MSVFYVLRWTDPNGGDHRYYGGEFVGAEMRPRLLMVDDVFAPQVNRWNVGTAEEWSERVALRHATDTRDELERDGHERLSVVRVETTMRVVS